MEEITLLEKEESFWGDPDFAAKIQKEKSTIESVIHSYQKLLDYIEEFEICVQMAKSENDEELAREALELSEKFKKDYAQMELTALLSEESDTNNAICSINAGAGGTESCDWAAMLARMIQRFCDLKKFKYKVIEYQSGDTAGLKSITFIVEGSFAYGNLKSETGIHRLVRISPFDANSRRHTSFASIFVSPEVDDDVEIEIIDSELKIDVYRAGGAGGQSVNTTDSAVRITHLPTGIVVTCQNERSQLQNKQMATKILKSRLYEKAMQDKKAEQDSVNAQKKEIGWGSQIRSYVLHPYKLVKDHRTQYEFSNPEKVLDGEIECFIDSYLHWNATKS